MKDEIFLLGNKSKNFWEMKPTKRGKAIMIFTVDRASSIEIFLAIGNSARINIGLLIFCISMKPDQPESKNRIK